jgi:hypothetical protein
MTDHTSLPQPDPVQQLAELAYYQLVHTLTGLLPSSLADTPEALAVRNQAAIARVAAMLPVNSDEADLAAHCVAARAQAEEIMRLLRVHADDIGLVLKLNAQYALMERTALADRAQLLRLQTARQKREKSPAACDQDNWAQHIAQQTLQKALDGPPLTPIAAPAPPEPTPAAQPDSLPPEPELRAAPPPTDAAILQSADEQLVDLAQEAERYAIIYPRRAQQIRRLGGSPPDCDFGPPDDDLVHAIVTGTSPALRALDTPAAAV